MQPFEIIKKLRKNAKLIQEDIAKVLKISRPSYTNKEKGKSAFSADELFIVLDFLKNYISDDEYLNAVTDLLGSQSKPDKDILKNISKPSPIDPAIELLQEFFQEEKKEIVMEKAGPLIQLVRELISENNSGGAGNITKITAEHQELIKNFNDQEAGKEANEWLLKLEKLDIEEFYLAIAMIKGKVRKYEQSINQKKTGTDTN